MFTLTLLAALVINMPQGETVPAKRFDWNEFHYVDSKPKPKFIKPLYIPGAARARRPVYTKPVTVITSDNLTVDCVPKYK
jgi:hypothetical protein